MKRKVHAAAFIFAQDGAHFVVAGRRDDQGQALVAELLELGADVMFVHADVRHEDEVRNVHVCVATQCV